MTWHGTRRPARGGIAPADHLSARTGASGADSQSIDEHQRVVHEIELHKLELRAQNQNLQDAQDVLEDSRAAYTSLYDYAPIGHVTLDSSGNIRRLNYACAALLGWERRFLQDLPLRVLLDRASARALDAHLRASLAARETTVVELTILTKDLPRTVELVTAPVLDRGLERGPSVGLHSAMIDISGRRRDEERREELLRREHEARLAAESANQIKEDFLAIVSHELRTPLAPMLLWLRALSAERDGDSLRSRAVAAIEASIKVQVAMIDDLVDVARGRHGKLHVERRPMDLRPMVTAAVDAVVPSAAANLIAIVVELTSESAYVLGDALRLQQVTQNLLTNAVKFTPEGGRITVAVNATAKEVILVVSDDGEGIDADLLENVFEPFRQRERAEVRRHGGLGLGLTIVRQLVAEHDGLVLAKSPGPGKGSTFTVTLPRHEAAALPIAETTIDARSVPPKDAASALAGLRVVVVEDQSDTREALAVILSTAGAQVATAASTDEGLNVISSTHPDVLVSDIGLPGDDGYTFIQTLRMRETEARSQRVPAIALTAHAGPRDRERALLAGFDRHVAKPIDFEDLVATIFAVAPRCTGQDRAPALADLPALGASPTV